MDTLGWNLHEDASKFLTLIYLQNENFSADSFLKISDQNLTRNYIFTIDNSLPVGDSIIDSYSSMLDFTSPDGDLFDLMYVKSGYLNIRITADLNMRGKMVFRLPEVTKNGKMLVSQFNYNGKPVDLKVDLSGYLITFTHVGNTNRLRTEFDVTAYNDGLPNFSPYHVKLEIKLNDLKFSKVFGYFSARSFSFTDRIRISLFGGVESGKVILKIPNFIFISIILSG